MSAEKLSEQQLLQKWGNGISKRRIGYSHLFQFARDILNCMGEVAPDGSKSVILQALENDEYDLVVLVDDGQLDKGVEQICISTHRSEIVDTERGRFLEKISEITLHREIRKGAERYDLMALVPPKRDPLIGATLFDGLMMEAMLTEALRKNTFSNLRSALVNTILERNSASFQD